MSAVAFLISVGSLLVVIMLQGIYLYWRIRRCERVKDRVMMLYIDQLQSQISTQQRNILQLAQRLDEAIASFRQTDKRTVSPYNQAIELIRQGANAVEVAQRCAISRSEAELIYSLYRNNPTP